MRYPSLISLIGVWLLAGSLSASAADLLPSDYRQKTYPVEKPLVLEYSFGGSPRNKVTLSVINYPNMRSDLFFIHLHMNELAAKQTGAELVRENGGTLMYLSHASGARDVKIKIGKKSYTFDPNRIFTAAGLEERTSPRPKGRDLEELRKFVGWVKQNIELGRLQRARPLVAGLHNNTDDDTHGERLSILTEQKLIGIDNLAANINSAWDIDNFFIATQPGTFEAILAGAGPNISLQMPNPRDIGYLSNWMINTGVEYLTIEAEFEDLHNNKIMMQAVQDLLR